MQRDIRTACRQHLNRASECITTGSTSPRGAAAEMATAAAPSAASCVGIDDSAVSIQSECRPIGHMNDCDAAGCKAAVTTIAANVDIIECCGGIAAIRSNSA